jgi:hypothetical protein
MLYPMGYNNPPDDKVSIYEYHKKFERRSKRLIAGNRKFFTVVIKG